MLVEPTQGTCPLQEQPNGLQLPVFVWMATICPPTSRVVFAITAAKHAEELATLNVPHVLMDSTWFTKTHLTSVETVSNQPLSSILEHIQEQPPQQDYSQLQEREWVTVDPATFSGTTTQTLQGTSVSPQDPSPTTTKSNSSSKLCLLTSGPVQDQW